MANAQNNPMHVRLAPDLPSLVKNICKEDDHINQPQSKHHNQMINNINMNPNTTQLMKFDQTTEFQALWNECHKASNRSQTSKMNPQSSPKCESAKKDNNPTQMPASSQILPQDPSAFLKAMLKISDDSSAPKPQVPKNTPQAPKPSDAPPLVQQLFDNARKAEKLKSQQQQAMNNLGFPSKMKPMENISDRVCKGRQPENYQMLNLPKPALPPKQWMDQNHALSSPDVRRMIPRPNFPTPHRHPGYQIPRPKWAVPQPPPPRSFFFSLSGPSMPIDKTNWRAPPSQPIPQKLQKSEMEIKKNTPFVPLQAEKKNRNAKTLKAKQKVEQTNKEQAPTQQEAVSLSSKNVVLKESQEFNPTQEKQLSLPRTKKIDQKKKSRLAANFGNNKVLNGAD